MVLNDYPITNDPYQSINHLKEAMHCAAHRIKDQATKMKHASSTLSSSSEPRCCGGLIAARPGLQRREL